jgi:hypothetical protein
MAHRVQGSSYRDHFLVDLYLVCTLVVRVLKHHHLEHTHSKQVDVHQLVVLLVHRWCHKLRYTCPTDPTHLEPSNHYIATTSSDRTTQFLASVLISWLTYAVDGVGLVEDGGENENDVANLDLSVTPGFGRQTECELCTYQDQNSRTQRLHKWTSLHNARIIT